MPTVRQHLEVPSAPAIRKATIRGVGDARPTSPSAPRRVIAPRVESASKVKVASTHEVASEPLETRPIGMRFDTLPDSSSDEVAAEPFESHPVGTRFDRVPDSSPREIPNDEFKLPTSGVPKWAVAAVVAAAVAAAGVVLVLTNEKEQKTAPAASSASGIPKQPPAAPSTALSHPTAKPAEPPQVPATAAATRPSASPSPPAPSSTQSTLKAPEPVGASSRPVKSIRSRAVASPPAAVQQGTSRTASVASPPPKKAPDRVAETAHPGSSNPVVTSPEVSRTLSPVDRIVAELRLISPDPVGIEDKARELARIIARSKRKVASQIIEDLGPPIAVDPLGRDLTLEESLRVFAISVLGRVSTDDDDNRAIDALFMLGEWTKSDGKGKQKALTMLEYLSHESIVKTSAPRLRALKTAQAQGE